MDFKQITARAAKRGYKLFMIVLNPEQQVHATVDNKNFADIFAVGMFTAAKVWAKNTGGKVSTDQVLMSLMKETQKIALLLAQQEVDPGNDFSPEQQAILERIRTLTTCAAQADVPDEGGFTA